ncbi:MAG: alpha/beta hydrolase [Cellvibrio sp.]|nr:alpha/beta hydrolase [Cellvibrio sp.]
MKQLIVLILLIGGLAGCNHLPDPGTSSAEQLLRVPYISSVDHVKRDYFVYLPSGYASQPDKNWPVILFLHGNGERGNGLDELDYVISHGPLYEAWIQKKDLPFIIISPQLHMFTMGNVPYIANRTRAQIPQRLAEGVPAYEPTFATPQPMSAGEEIKDMSAVPPLLPVGWDQVEQDLLGMISYVQKNYRTDLRRLYLTGLSYGGFGTWFMASKHSNLFAAAVPVVGWGHPDLMAPIAKANLPVWAFAGGRDTAVQKKFFYAGINKLEESGDSEVRFTVHEDRGHDAWKRIYASKDLYDWLLAHRKK